MIAKVPEAPARRRQERAEQPRTQARQQAEVKVSPQVLALFREEYSLSETMSPKAYRTFLDNLDQDYGYLLESKVLLDMTAKAGMQLKEAVEGQDIREIKSAEKRLAKQINKAIRAMGSERKEELTPQEAMAARLLVTKAMTEAPEQAAGQRQDRARDEEEPRRDERSVREAAARYRDRDRERSGPGDDESPRMPPMQRGRKRGGPPLPSK